MLAAVAIMGSLSEQYHTVVWRLILLVWQVVREEETDKFLKSRRRDQQKAMEVLRHDPLIKYAPPTPLSSSHQDMLPRHVSLYISRV
jgi:hypothetical protein